MITIPLCADKEKLINLPNDVSLCEAELELELRKRRSRAQLCHCADPMHSLPVLGGGKSPEAKNQSGQPKQEKAPNFDNLPLFLLWSQLEEMKRKHFFYGNSTENLNIESRV